MDELKENYSRRYREITEKFTSENKYHVELAKNGVGAPSKYDPLMVDLVLALYSKGLSKQQICRELGISITTYERWRIAHAEFGEAHRLGQGLARAEWDRICQKNLGNKLFQSQLFLQTYKNRFNTADDSTISIANFDSEQDFKHNSAAVIKALCDGHISPSQADNVLNALQKVYNISSVENIKEELEKIKDQIKEIDA